MTAATSTCPSCGNPASGRFCSTCGTALAGAACANCTTPLTPGARFCHRCGNPAGASAVQSRGFAAAMPWALAAIALVALIALVVGQRFGSRPEQTEPMASTGIPDANRGTAMPRAPDISQMTPVERAERLYDRIMRESEAGNAEAARTFLPMAIAAYEALSPMTLDQRYDLGRVGEVAGDVALAKAQADTIINARPTHLLGLLLAGNVARLEKNEKNAKEFDARFLAAEPAEKAAALPEYAQHTNDIQAALGRLRAVK